MTPHLTQSEIAELAALYAVGLLPPAEADAFEDRLLAGDPVYVEEFKKVRPVGDLLLRQSPTLAAPEIKLPAPTLKLSGGSAAPSARASAVSFWKTSAAFGWLAAAASLVFAVIIWRNAQPKPIPPTPPGPTIDTIAAMTGTANLKWTYWAPKKPGEVDSDVGELVPGADKVTGRVAWNNTIQQGFVEFANLPTNVPADAQYQLWIIDEKQPAPISAGVFNASTGTTIVPMTPYVRVEKPIAVALTLERPGGVVKPDQKRRVVVAPVQGG